MFVSRILRYSRGQLSNPRLFTSGTAVRSAGAEGISEGLVITDACVQRMQKLSQGKSEPLKLRLSVTPGGCEGFQYEFSLEDSVEGPHDKVFERDGVKVLVDDISYDLVRGSKIDYEQEIVRSAFVVSNNPNAESGCGCGSSFSASS